MIVLVCGGRDYADRATLYRRMDALAIEWGAFSVLEGGARGADTLVREWCAARGLTCTTVRADWTEYPRAAGAIRNQAMLDRYRPSLVVAFPGGDGTADMVRRARRAGVPVLEGVPGCAPEPKVVQEKLL